MCELFGMSSRYPTTVKFSLKAFKSHWETPKRKADGWGIAFGRRKDFLLVKEPVPAGKSETLHWIFHERDFRLVHHIPLGETDSEHIFCFFLDRIREEVGVKQKNDSAAISNLLNYYALKIEKLGVLNFLMSDSKYLYAFRSSKLYSAQRDCVCRNENLKGGPLSIKMGPACPTKNQSVRLIAAVLLTKDNCWKSLQPKKIVVFYKGKKID